MFPDILEVNAAHKKKDGYLATLTDSDRKRDS